MSISKRPERAKSNKHILEPKANIENYYERNVLDSRKYDDFKPTEFNNLTIDCRKNIESTFVGL